MGTSRLRSPGRRPPCAGRRRWLCAFVLSAVSVAWPVQALPPTEHQVKAAFLYNFANLVKWPEAALGSTGAPVRVCVLGADPFRGALDEAFEGKVVQGRSVEVVRGRTLEALGSCHILFLPRTEEPRWPELVKTLRDRPTLTVGDGPPLARLGGMVNFFVEDRRVRFEVNVVAAEHAGLRISSKLLTLARLVASS